MLETFCDMNLEMQRTGNFSTSIGKEQLLKLVAQNNIILVRTLRPPKHISSLFALAPQEVGTD